MRYIDADKLIAEIERRKEQDITFRERNIPVDIEVCITSLQQEQDMGEVSDGYHTFNELYYYRMLYNAAFFNLLPKNWVHKSKRHHTGEECFGGGWFIVTANLPTGQISNHYELKDWDLFKVQEKEFADEWDGHTPQEAAERLHRYLLQWHRRNLRGFIKARFDSDEQLDVDLEKYIEREIAHYGLSLYEASYGTFSASQIDRIIRNAFDLGLNTRKV